VIVVVCENAGIPAIGPTVVFENVFDMPGRKKNRDIQYCFIKQGREPIAWKSAIVSNLDLLYHE
jgi:hypothetical protein